MAAGPETEPVSESAGTALRVTVAEGLSQVSSTDWNRLAGEDNPFLRHEFLIALERNGCVGADSGWYPRHLLVYSQARLVGAAPMYIKAHSYGEFGSDWAWADAYQRAGVAYYPKLVSAIPFTPVAGRRLLCAPGDDSTAIRTIIVEAALEIARSSGVSSLQWLFASQDDYRLLKSEQHSGRIGCQYHWQNHGYRDFQDYLDALRSKRRKQVRRERREANAGDVEIRVLSGGDASPADWHAYHALYSATYDRKWGYPSLTPEFFCEVGRTMPDSAMLVLAYRGRDCVAGAHLFRGAHDALRTQLGLQRVSALPALRDVLLPRYRILHPAGTRRVRGGRPGGAQDLAGLRSANHLFGKLVPGQPLPGRHRQLSAP